jgi:hypothetical protein
MEYENREGIWWQEVGKMIHEEERKHYRINN